MRGAIDFTVVIAAPTLPRAGVNMTGSPSLILKHYHALKAQGTRVRMLELGMTGTAHISAFSGTPGLPLVSIKIVRELLRTKPAVMHCHGHTTAGVMLPYARLCGVPIVCELHGLYVSSRSRDPQSRPFLSKLAAKCEMPVLRLVDRVIVQAEAMRQHLIAAGITPDCITRLYPGLRVAEIRDYAGKEPAGLTTSTASGKLVVYVGSHHGYQGLDLLQKAQQELRQGGEAGFQFVLVLSNDGTNVDPKAMYGFDDSTSVVQLTDSAQVPAWLKRADILIHTRPDIPDNINVQSKLGLYLAAGRPIVATDVGDYRLLLSGLPGCVLAPPDPAAIAQAIRRAAETEVVLGAVRNPEAADRYFDIAKNTEKLVDIYTELLDGRRRTATIAVEGGR